MTETLETATGKKVALTTTRRGALIALAGGLLGAVAAPAVGMSSQAPTEAPRATGEYITPKEMLRVIASDAPLAPVSPAPITGKQVGEFLRNYEGKSLPLQLAKISFGIGEETLAHRKEQAEKPQQGEPEPLKSAQPSRPIVSSAVRRHEGDWHLSTDTPGTEEGELAGGLQLAEAYIKLGRECDRSAAVVHNMVWTPVPERRCLLLELLDYLQSHIDGYTLDEEYRERYDSHPDLSPLAEFAHYNENTTLSEVQEMYSVAKLIRDLDNLPPAPLVKERFNKRGF